MPTNLPALRGDRRTRQEFERLRKQVDGLLARVAELEEVVDGLGGGGGGGDTTSAYVQTLFATGTVTGPTATTSPTAILSRSIPANTLSSDGQLLDVDISGTLLNTSGSNRTWGVAISLGGVELFRDTTGQFVSSATERPWSLRFSITRLSSTTCFLGGSFIWQTATSTPDTGLGFISATSLAGPISSAVSSPTVDWGSAQTLAVTVTCNSNHASTNFLARSARIYKSPTG